MKNSPAKAEQERRTNFRLRAVRVFLVTLFISGAFAAVLGRGGYLELRRAVAKVERQQAQIESGEVQLQLIRQTVQALEENPMARERIAREQLGMAGPGEILFLLPEEER